jgi:hypothetical protein
MHVEEVKINLQKMKTNEGTNGIRDAGFDPTQVKIHEEAHKKPHSFFSKIGPGVRQDSKLMKDATEVYAPVHH